MSKITVARGQQVIGEFTSEEISEHLQNGNFHSSDLVYAEGYDDWKPIGEVFGNANLHISSPSVPTSKSKYPKWAMAIAAIFLFLILGLNLSRFIGVFSEQIAEQKSSNVTDVRQLAEKGDPSAQYNLGVMYHNGRGVEKDEVEAFKWYQKAAEQGDADAQNNLGVMYANGRGVEKDEVEAVKWYQKAAEQGDAAAQTNLGVMYEDGSGVEKDEVEAVKWYQKAAEQGYALAQYNLGLMYAKGSGVERNFYFAYAWLIIAEVNGADTEKIKSILEEEMTPEQIAKAQELTKEVVKKNPRLISE
jgi:hypothetical protein